MASFVLVHGAWHGGWCWSRVLDALVAAGHSAVAPDLPGHGADPTPIGSVTLDDYAARILSVCEAQSEPVVLVGHSMGGVVITRVAELAPERVAALVYLAAFLPAPGETLFSLASRDAGSRIGEGLESTDDGRATIIREDFAPVVFYGDCEPAVAAEASRKLCPTAVQPLTDPVDYSDARFGRVRRVYIECGRDAAVSPTAQREIQLATAFERVIHLDAGHSPFLSMPGAVAHALGSVSG